MSIKEKDYEAIRIATILRGVKKSLIDCECRDDPRFLSMQETLNEIIKEKIGKIENNLK